MLKNGHLLGGRYVVEQTIAKGGMGAVYLVRDRRLGDKAWAAKEVAHYDADERDFIEEARLLTELSHPYIPKVVDYFEPDSRGNCYLIMEHVEGRNLHELLSSSDTLLTLSKAVHYMVELCDVLAYLHERSRPVIFRDLKPSNVMVDEHGHIKLIDFGIARSFKKGQMTDTVALGTVAFASPEQLENRQTDGRSDLYSLGATFYYVLTGGKHYYQSEASFSMLPVGIPGELKELLARLLARNPEDRFETARDVKAALLAVSLPGGFLLTRPEETPVPRTIQQADPTVALNPYIARRERQYTVLATQSTPALIIYLIDVSGSMGMEMEGERRIDIVRTALLTAIKQMVFRSTKGSRIAGRYRLAILAYSDDVYDLLGGVKSIDEVARTGALPELVPLKFTDTAKAFARAEQILLEELPGMDNCPAPLICHMTDGAHTGEDPEPIAKRIMEMAVPDGHVLIENIFITDTVADEALKDAKRWKGYLPDTPLQDEYLRKLRNMSSILPESYRDMVLESSYSLERGTVMLLPGTSTELVGLGLQMSAATPIR
ncbi:Serine/threonine protein kinase [Paenibacillus tarimensis]